MPVLILLIILDLAIVGWVLWVGIRDNTQLAASAHGVPEKDSPQVERVERGEATLPPTLDAPPAPVIPGLNTPPIDTRFIRQGALPDTEETRLEDVEAAQSASEAVVSVRPARSEASAAPVVNQSSDSDMPIETTPENITPADPSKDLSEIAADAAGSTGGSGSTSNDAQIQTTPENITPADPSKGLGEIAADAAGGTGRSSRKRDAQIKTTPENVTPADPSKDLGEIAQDAVEGTPDDDKQ